MNTNPDVSTPASPIRLLSRREVGERCGVHPGSVARWERQGLIKAVKLNSRVTRYPESELMRFIANGTAA